MNGTGGRPQAPLAWVGEDRRDHAVDVVALGLEVRREARRAASRS